MNIPQSSFTANAVEDIITGPGIIFLNYGETDERQLGMTRGGNAFSAGVTYRDIEVDSFSSNIKGLRLVDEIMPTITSNQLVMSIENLKTYLPGLQETTESANSTTHTILSLGQLKDADYFKNITLAASMTGEKYTGLVLLQILNGISDGNFSISLGNKEEGVVSATFTGMFSPVDMEAYITQDDANPVEFQDIVPFRIHYPNAQAPA